MKRFIAAMVIGLALSVSAGAGESGVLKLKVCTCEGTWLSGARVDVEIWRVGYGEVDSDMGYTASDGYIEIEFDDLWEDDEARATVTPQGDDADSGHTFVWEEGDGESGGVWQIPDDPQRMCPDNWFNEAQNIIRCRVED